MSAPGYIESKAPCAEGLKYSFTNQKASDCKITLHVVNPTPEQLAATRKSLGIGTGAATTEGAIQ